MSEVKIAMSEARGRVARAIEALLPRDPSPAHLTWLHLGTLSSLPARPLQGADLEALYVGPIRQMVERGGKCWRSLLLEACCETVGGDFGPFELLLALPELVHVGSLIVDDVQDGSTTRRGGPTCHLLHGPALAVNAGTGAYFLAERALDRVPLDAVRRDAIRTLMFDAFRAAHAGQALDLGGFDALVEEVFAERVPRSALREQVEVVHWLKTAVPAAAFARVGCLLGGDDGGASACVSAYVEAVGMGFQAIDDVLDLRGFPGGLKSPGDDLRDGKLTLPVALALERLDLCDGRRLWSRIRARPQDPREIAAITGCLEACGAIADTEQMAYDGADRAWNATPDDVRHRPAAAVLRQLGDALLRRQY